MALRVFFCTKEQSHPMRIFSGVRIFLLGVLVATAGWTARAAEVVYHCDVAVLGSGAAGLSAAVAAAESGAKVLVLEKMPVVGGSSVLAADYITALGPRAEAIVGHPLSVRSLYNEIVHFGGGRNDPEIVAKLLLMTEDAYEWITSLGASLSVPVPVREGGEWAGFRTDTKGTTVGGEIVKALLRNAENRGIPIETLTRATEIMMDKGVVTGVRASDIRGDHFIVRAPAVVIATGSYAANPEMVMLHASPEERKLTAMDYSTNAPGDTGDGLALGHMAGGAVRDLELLEFHPTMLATSGDVISSSVRTHGAILVNHFGKRFVNELAPRRVVMAAMEAQPGDSAWLIADEDVLARDDIFSDHPHMLSAVTGDTVEELARRIGVDENALQETFNAYRAGRARGHDAFGRRTMESDLRQGRLYAFPVRSAVHGTSGGLVADEHAQVQRENGTPIMGLYAAGDVMSGLNGLERVSGMGLVGAIVFGREAGYSAARYARPELPVPDSYRSVPSAYSLQLDPFCVRPEEPSKKEKE